MGATRSYNNACNIIEPWGSLSIMRYQGKTAHFQECTKSIAHPESRFSWLIKGNCLIKVGMTGICVSHLVNTKPGLPYIKNYKGLKKSCWIFILFCYLPVRTSVFSSCWSYNFSGHAQLTCEIQIYILLC